MPDQIKVTPKGRLSFPQFTAQGAYEQSQRGSYPSPDVASTAPNFLMLLTDVQHEKVKKALIEFVESCVENNKRGEKRNSLTPAQAKLVLQAIEDPESATVNTPFKTVSEKTLELAPDTAAAIKVMGTKGSDLDQLAVCRNENEMLSPDPDILDWPKVLDARLTVHQLYAGCWVKATITFYAYVAGKQPGVAASTSACVWVDDDTKFGGGAGVDLDEIFLDD